MSSSPIMKGRVIRVSGLLHLVDAEGECWQCELRGRLKEGRRRTSSPVIVGDWVDFKPTGTAAGIIEQVHPRYSQFSRAASGSRTYEQIIAANIDQLVVVVSLRQPVQRIGFIDRAIIMALKGEMAPAICINKIDLDRHEERFRIGHIYRDLGYSVVFTSALSGDGIESFRKMLKGKVSAIIGHSGVGKSSLLNCIDPNLAIKTQELMVQHDRGRHTTTAVQLYGLPGGGYVADTPGIKELQLWEIDRGNLVDYFEEIARFAPLCQFRDCSHMHEPGCAVRAEVGASVSELRYEGYCRLMDSITGS